VAERAENPRRLRLARDRRPGDRPGRRHPEHPAEPSGDRQRPGRGPDRGHREQAISTSRWVAPARTRHAGSSAAIRDLI